MKYTEASKNLFLDTGIKFPRSIIWAVASIKLAACRVNRSLGLLQEDMFRAIEGASVEVMNGKYDDLVTVDVFQTGSGTGINMNVNEIIAQKASEISGLKVHPNDHVNMSQSSNDVIPTAIRIAAIYEVKNKLLPSLQSLILSLREFSEMTGDVYKAGRTHLRDALPVTMGQEFSAYSDAFSHDLELLKVVSEHVREIPIGGTAVGTGLNAPLEFDEMMIRELKAITNIELKLANKFRAMRLLTDLVMLSGVMRSIAMNLYRLSQDIRLMFSGPFTGLNEIDIPSQEEIAGSSIMPGKTNPVTVEATLLACAQVIGLDHANQIAGMLGEFELSMGVPLIGYNIVTQIHLLSEAMNKMSSIVIPSIRPNKELLKRYAESSPALITIISPIIGYDKASQIGKKITKNMTIREILREEGFTDEQINQILNLKDLVKPGIPAKKQYK
ncbi:MAG: class II fumarate hydratase [Thermoprotei archaeon]|jgi:fumarate hydratase class II